MVKIAKRRKTATREQNASRKEILKFLNKDHNLDSVLNEEYIKLESDF